MRFYFLNKLSTSSDESSQLKETFPSMIYNDGARAKARDSTVDVQVQYGEMMENSFKINVVK